MYTLYFDFTGRKLPAKVNSKDLVELPKRDVGESIGFDAGGDIALLIDADGDTLATYTYKDE